MEQRKVKNKFENMSKETRRTLISLMIMENLGRYNILKGTVFDLSSFSVIKIVNPGSNWKFETNWKSGLIFDSFFLSDLLPLYSRNGFLLVCLFVIFAGFGKNGDRPLAESLSQDNSFTYSFIQVM